MQALYQWQLTDHSPTDLKKQYTADEESAGADFEYFGEVVSGVIANRATIHEALAGLIDRPVNQLDPVEASILMIGVFELAHRADVPYRVVINEAVNLSKRFGATDGHKYVNAVLDRAAAQLRKAERT
jgi:N utilization substance protein B